MEIKKSVTNVKRIAELKAELNAKTTAPSERERILRELYNLEQMRDKKEEKMQSIPKFTEGETVHTNGTTGKILKVIPVESGFVYETKMLGSNGVHTFEEDEIGKIQTNVKRSGLKQQGLCK